MYKGRRARFAVSDAVAESLTNVRYCQAGWDFPFPRGERFRKIFKGKSVRCPPGRFHGNASADRRSGFSGPSARVAFNIAFRRSGTTVNPSAVS